jgi:VWFA-related protein
LGENASKEVHGGAIQNRMKLRLTKLMLIPAVCLLSASLRAQAPAGPIPQPGDPVETPPKIQVHSVLVNMPVTVRDTKGEMVNTLEKTDFHVTDNGVPQTISHFTLGGDPISLVVVVETSWRVGPILPQIRKTGILISQTIVGPTGEAAVIGYDDQVRTLLDFTSSSDDLEQTMAHLQRGYAGSRLFDAMSRAVAMLSAKPEVSETDLGKRRVMLIIGEAHDSGSEEKLGEVLRRAQLANITIYAVGVSGLKADLKRDPEDKAPPSPTPDGTFGEPPPPGTINTPTTEQQAAESGTPLQVAIALAVWTVTHSKDRVTSHQLEIAAAATGGQHVSVWKSRTIEQVLDDMGGELHSQYTLSYIPKGDLANGYHQINVTIDHKKQKLTIRARPGYYIEAPGS